MWVWYYGGNAYVYNGMHREKQVARLTKWLYPEIITLTLNMSDTDGIQNKYGTLTMRKSVGKERILQDEMI